MCGICGVYHHHLRAPVDETILSNMTRILAHRGPDGEGFHVAGPIGLGHRRLSIIDVAGGVQPQSNEDQKIWVTFNGEIYNYKDLSQELKRRGHVFRTRSDTEVIVHGYEEWGDDVMLHLNGIFAFGLWDSKTQHLLLARDHLGVKPLYYFNDETKLIFASELKALFEHPAVDAKVDPNGLQEALMYGFMPSPYTLFQGVQKLGPGFRLIAEPEKVRIERYWHPIPQVSTTQSTGDVIEELQTRIETAVERQMMSDVPVGALLSGGVDSTAVVSIMRKYHKKVRTFSIGVGDSPEINELAMARETAKRLGTQHEEVEIGAQDYMDFLEKAHWHLEEPCTPSALLNYFVCDLAKKSVKVVLTGQGADELFGGYSRYLGEHYGKYYRRMPKIITQTMLPRMIDFLPVSMRLKRGVYALAQENPVGRFSRIYEVFSAQDRQALLHPDIYSQLQAQEAEYEALSRWSLGLDKLDGLSQLLYIDLRCNLADNLLMFGDKMSMAASVEARVPFLDLDLVHFAETLPSHLKIKYFKPKYLFKQALKKWVPTEILNRPKLGFQIPEAKWFRGRLLTYTTDLLLAQNSLSRSFFQPECIRQILDTHKQGRQNMWRQIFCLVSLEMLYQSFVKTTK